MSVHFICPSCGGSSRVSAPVPELCRLCQAPLPAPLWATLNAEAEREAVQLPTLLMLGRFGTTFMGGIFLLFLLLAPWDIGTYSIGEEVVSGPEFLRRAGVAWGVIAISLLVTAYALWTDRWWSRWMMMIYWVLVTAAAVSLNPDRMEGVISGVIFLACCGAPAAWYLFAKENVVAYYRMLEREADRESAAPEKPA